MPCRIIHKNGDNPTRAYLQSKAERYYARNHVIHMILELKLRKVGNSIGVVLPKEALARLNVEDGDSIVLTDAPDGGFRVTPAQATDFAAQMTAAESIIKRYRNTFRELAK